VGFLGRANIWNVVEARENDVILCSPQFCEKCPEMMETESSLKSLFRTPLSFLMGVEAAIDKQVAKIQIANITPASAVEKQLSVPVNETAWYAFTRVSTRGFPTELKEPCGALTRKC
jgi:hypothetical protein